MKKFSLFTVLACSVLSVTAQVRQPGWIGDTLGPWSVITFEEPSGYVSLDPSAQNIWQVGKPQKTFFNMAYSLPNAMVTDTLNYYPDNNQSSFDLCIGGFNTNGMYPFDLFIDFRHKFDSDTLHDGGYISVSWDHRQTWINIIDDTVPGFYFFATPARQWGQWGNTNLYSSGNTLINSEHGYSGRSNGWVHSCMAWYNLPVKRPVDFSLPDTMFLRFNFISDDIHHNKEGWMIDQIRIFSIDLGSGIRDIMPGTKHAWVAPNPIRTSAMVTFDKVYTNVFYMLMDPSGRVLRQGSPGKCSEFSINRDHLSAGVYFLKITIDQNYSEVHRVVIRD